MIDSTIAGTTQADIAEALAAFHCQEKLNDSIEYDQHVNHDIVSDSLAQSNDIIVPEFETEVIINESQSEETLVVNDEFVENTEQNVVPTVFSSNPADFDVSIFDSITSFRNLIQEHRIRKI